jgi:hypothetical protein
LVRSGQDLPNPASPERSAADAELEPVRSGTPFAGEQ